MDEAIDRVKQQFTAEGRLIFNAPYSEWTGDIFDQLACEHLELTNTKGNYFLTGVAEKDNKSPYSLCSRATTVA